MSGARSNCFVIDTCQQERVVGIQFLPGGAFPFFRTPASDVKDVSIDLEDVWPKRTAEIREQLLAAVSQNLSAPVIDPQPPQLRAEPGTFWLLNLISRGYAWIRGVDRYSSFLSQNTSRMLNFIPHLPPRNQESSFANMNQNSVFCNRKRGVLTAKSGM